jgi:hypothetical protein
LKKKTAKKDRSKEMFLREDYENRLEKEQRILLTYSFRDGGKLLKTRKKALFVLQEKR